MKKWIFVLSAIWVFNVYGDDGWIDCGKDMRNQTLCYYKIEDDGTLYVKAQNDSTTTGLWQNAQSQPTGPWYAQKDEITKIVVDESITQIGLRAFSKLDKVTEVVIPSSVTSIGAAAFQSCPGFKSINLPSNLKSIDSYAFALTNLEEITIPDSVTSIGNRAFAHNLLLSGTVNLENVETVDQYAFSECPKLQSIIIGDKMKSVGKNAFYGTSAYVYCQEGDGHGGKSCAELVKESGITGGKLKIYAIENGKIKIGSKTYNGFEELPQYVLRRIYTIDEANRVAGEKNRVSIKYR